MSASLDQEILVHVSHLHSLARYLARDRSLAEDLVQETLMRALRHSGQFEAGTNLKAWLSTILRNSYFNEKRSEARRRRLAQLGPYARSEHDSAPGSQEARLEMRDLRRAYASLPATQREAIALVGAQGFTYEEAAMRAGCAVGTMKSRVSRARLALLEVLSGDDCAATRHPFPARGADEARPAPVAPHRSPRSGIARRDRQRGLGYREGASFASWDIRRSSPAS